MEAGCWGFGRRLLGVERENKRRKKNEEQAKKKKVWLGRYRDLTLGVGA